MKTLFKINIAALGFLALAGSLQAQTSVGVQIPGWAGALNSDSGYATPGIGYFAGAVPQQYWNTANGIISSYDSPVSFTNSNLTYGYGGSTSATLMDSTGAATTVTFTISNITDNRGSEGGGGWPDIDTQGNPDWQFSGSSNMSNFLTEGIAAAGSASTPITLTLGGLNAGDTYDLYAYVGGTFYAGTTDIAVSFGGLT